MQKGSKRNPSVILHLDIVLTRNHDMHRSFFLTVEVFPFVVFFVIKHRTMPCHLDAHWSRRDFFQPIRFLYRTIVLACVKFTSQFFVVFLQTRCLEQPCSQLEKPIMNAMLSPCMHRSISPLNFLSWLARRYGNQHFFHRNKLEKLVIRSLIVFVVPRQVWWFNRTRWLRCLRFIKSKWSWAVIVYRYAISSNRIE